MQTFDILQITNRCYLDSHLTMEKQANAIIKSCCFQRRLIWTIRRYLDLDGCKTLVDSTVTSRLDDCNVLLIGSDQGLFDRLQRIQNMAASLVMQKS